MYKVILFHQYIILTIQMNKTFIRQEKMTIDKTIDKIALNNDK